MRLCPVPRCPNPSARPSGGRCRVHMVEREKARGTRQQRGYDAAHEALRAAAAPRVATGTVRCWRCKQLIEAGAPWHLGHDDADRRRYRGPEHVHCNLGAAGRMSH